jgi:hypothetical protein
MKINDHFTKKPAAIAKKNTSRKQHPEKVTDSESFLTLQRVIENPTRETITPNIVLQLQRTIGNQATTRILKSHRLNLLGSSREASQTTHPEKPIQRTPSPIGYFMKALESGIFPNIKFPREMHIMRVMYLNGDGKYIKALMNLLASGYKIFSFSKATQYRIPGKGEPIPYEVDATNFLRGTVRRNEIYINAHLSPSEAAMTLMHEIDHVLTKTTHDDKDSEVEARFNEEQHRIHYKLPPKHSTYRNDDGTVNRDAIRTHIMGMHEYNIMPTNEDGSTSHPEYYVQDTAPQDEQPMTGWTYFDF